MKLTQNRPASRIAGQVVDDLAGQTRIIGGSSETEVTEFAAIPVGAPSPPNAVSTVTPVGRRASTRRYSDPVILLGATVTPKPYPSTRSIFFAVVVNGGSRSADSVSGSALGCTRVKAQPSTRHRHDDPEQHGLGLAH